MVKVVLCRFIKSQLTGQSLINAFGKADDEKKRSMALPECAECRDVDHVTTQQASGAESQKS